MKLTDLGLARAFADAKNTRAGAVTGTVQYLAPEQIRGEPADPRSDLYSLGIVGVRAADRPAAVHRRDADGDRVQAPVGPGAGALVGRRRPCPRTFDGFIASATDPDRELRPESAAAMRRDLASFSATLERARTLASLVNDVPRVVRDPVVGDATASDRRRGDHPDDPAGRAAPSPSRPQAPRRACSRCCTVAVAAWGAWTYVIPHSHADPERGRA